MIASTAVSGVAQASDSSGAYLGAGIGTGIGATHTSQELEHQGGNKVAGKIFAGYNFNKNWALEGGYTNFNKSEFGAYATGKVDGQPAEGEVLLKTKSSAFYLAGKGSYPINDQFSLFSKLGVTRNHFSADGIGSVAIAQGTPPTALRSISGNKLGLYASVGAEYAINQNVSLSLEYEHYGKNRDGFPGRPDDLVTVGLRYNF